VDKVLIESVTAVVLKVRADEPYLGQLRDGNELTDDDGYVVRDPWRSLYSARFETLLVRVTASDGTTGWGEALAPVGPEIPAEVVRRLLAPQLIGRHAGSPRVTWAAMRALMRERGHLTGHQADALAAVDIALWDLAGRITGRSVAELLGGAFRTTVPTYLSGLPRPDDASRAELARDWADRGVRAVKLHLGNGVDADLTTVDAVLAAAPELRVAVDAHWAYRLPEARRLGRELGARGGLFLEAPMAPENLADHRRLADSLELPVAVGESLRNRYEFQQWIGAGAVGLAQPDVARTGITECWSITELAAAYDVPVALHHSVGLGVALAAGLHLSAALEDSPFFEYQPASTDVANQLLRSPIEGGPVAFTLPAGPGLGIDLDEELIGKLATEGT
jgi:D-galactarolactone cycloisomerase